MIRFASKLVPLAALVLVAGCIVPRNQKDFIKGDVEATSLDYPGLSNYSFFKLGSDRHPIKDASSLCFIIEGKTISLDGLKPDQLIAAGGKESGDFSSGWPHGAKAYYLGSNNDYFVFLKDKLIEAGISTSAIEGAPHMGVSRSKGGRVFYLPIPENELVELLGSPDRIRWWRSW